jgi:predicted Zn finger-like uncharacterized protein
MSVCAVCPECRQPFTLADSQEGKKVRCSKCQAVFVAREAPTQRPADEDVMEVAVVAPRKRSTGVRQAEEDEPRRAAPARGRSAAEDAEEERPRQGNGEKANADTSPLLWLGIGGGGVLLLGGIVLAVVLLTRKDRGSGDRAAGPPPSTKKEGPGPKGDKASDAGKDVPGLSIVERTSFSTAPCTDFMQFRISPDGQVVLNWGGPASKLVAYDVPTKQALYTLPLSAPTGTAGAIAISPDGRHLIAHVARLALRDLRTGRPLSNLEAPDGFQLPRDLHCSQTGDLLFGRDSNHACLWDTRTGKHLWKWQPHGELFFDAALTPDGARVVTAGVDSTGTPDGLHCVKVWDVKTREVPYTILGAPSPEKVAVSPDGKVLAVVHTSTKVAFTYDLERGATRRSLNLPGPYASSPTRCRFLADGKTLLLASMSHKHNGLRYWCSESDDRLRAWQGPGLTGMVDATLTPDGRTLATLTKDGVVKVWDVKPPGPTVPPRSGGRQPARRQRAVGAAAGQGGRRWAWPG